MKRKHDKRFTVKQPEVIVNIQPKVQPTPEPLYCIEENVTTGWEVLETNLTRANCESKFKWYAEQFTIPPQSIRIRRVR